MPTRDGQRVDHDVVPDERSRLQARPSLGGDERGVEHAVARHGPAAARRVAEQAEPAQFGGRETVGRIVVGPAVGALAHRGHRVFGSR